MSDYAPCRWAAHIRDIIQLLIHILVPVMIRLRSKESPDHGTVQVDAAILHRNDQIGLSVVHVHQVLLQSHRQLRGAFPPSRLVFYKGFAADVADDVTRHDLPLLDGSAPVLDDVSIDNVARCIDMVHGRVDQLQGVPDLDMPRGRNSRGSKLGVGFLADAFHLSSQHVW